MIINWYGEACFLLEAGGVRVMIEPPQKDSGITSPRLKSDVLIYSEKRAERSESEAFVIDGPGEYEVKGINVLGVADGSNTLYAIEIDGIKIAHLGFMKEEPTNEKLALLDDPDIVLVPAGGITNKKGLPAGRQGEAEILDASSAMKVINKMEPYIAIPMLYDIRGLKTKRAPLKDFIKESEAEESPQPKLVIKNKDLIEGETKIIILEQA